jgi:hypothetical protein
LGSVWLQGKFMGKKMKWIFYFCFNITLFFISFVRKLEISVFYIYIYLIYLFPKKIKFCLATEKVRKENVATRSWIHIYLSPSSEIFYFIFFRKWTTVWSLRKWEKKTEGLSLYFYDLVTIKYIFKIFIYKTSQRL